MSLVSSQNSLRCLAVHLASLKYIRMPFGLKNTPAIFQAAVDVVLEPFVGIMLMTSFLVRIGATI